MFMVPRFETPDHRFDLRATWRISSGGNLGGYGGRKIPEPLVVIGIVTHPALCPFMLGSTIVERKQVI